MPLGCGRSKHSSPARLTHSVNWTVRLSQVAEEDFARIIEWTNQRFGKRQAKACAQTLILAIQKLSRGPHGIGIRTRDDIGDGILALHVAHAGRKARHFLILRLAKNESEVIEVIRILHDATDRSRHVGTRAES